VLLATSDCTVYSPSTNLSIRLVSPWRTCLSGSCFIRLVSMYIPCSYLVVPGRSSLTNLYARTRLSGSCLSSNLNQWTCLSSGSVARRRTWIHGPNCSSGSSISTNLNDWGLRPSNLFCGCTNPFSLGWVSESNLVGTSHRCGYDMHDLASSKPQIQGASETDTWPHHGHRCSFAGSSYTNLIWL